MIWEVEIFPKTTDAELQRVSSEFDLLTHSQRGNTLLSKTSRGYLLEGGLSATDVEKLRLELLTDTVVENSAQRTLEEQTDSSAHTVLLKPGVMDPVAESVLLAARDLGLALVAVRTFRRYYPSTSLNPADQEILFRRILANDAIEQIVTGSLHTDHLSLGKAYSFQKIVVPLRSLDDAGLQSLSKQGQLALNLEEMQVIQKHFQRLGRDPVDVELETIAQTWSEHCSHKTLKGPIDYYEIEQGRPVSKPIKNLLKETVFGATQKIRQQLGDEDWCVSVFKDNAGVVLFDEKNYACIKVETHNHPSAIEPYGGANTGLGGVIRDPMGTGLGAKPICNTDVFCFAPPDYPPEKLPPGVLHPRRVMQGVVAGVRDYGNRMGIPTINGALIFDERYLANPLVFCGTVGLIPVGRAEKAAHAGDLIVAVGGRTGRDGIHGATFSSLELTEESESVSGGAVQIGNAITEKKVLDVILQARDQGLYHAITDCGAGGFSSAVGEMGAELGAKVHLEKAPLKYEGLSYTEIWISESQERMVLAVPPDKWLELEALCRSEGVEAAILGTFEATGKLELFYQGTQVADLSMEFLHEGRPETPKKAEWSPPPLTTNPPPTTSTPADVLGTLKAILGHYSVCSKEWVIRQYDHEVQGGSVIKPLVGIQEDGPSDASVIAPVLGSYKGLAIGCGLNPRYGDLDPYWMAANVIDEALRNVVAVGADPKRTAILDNFCWGNVNDPQVLGSLVRAAWGCHDTAIAFQTPFVSGKDSLNNQYTSADRKISIPGTLLVTAMGQVADVRKCLSMDLKEAGNLLYLIGETREEFGGSYYHLVTGQGGGQVPRVDLVQAPKLFSALHQAIQAGLLRACHDLSEGGLAVSLAEMAFAGGVGADLTDFAKIPAANDIARLFSESPTRFVVEVEPKNAAALEAHFSGLPLTRIGSTVKEPRLRIAGSHGEWLLWAKLEELKQAWQSPLKW